MRYYYNDSQKRFDLGTYPLMTLTEARAEDLRLRKKLEQGYASSVVSKLEKQAIIAAKSFEGLFALWYAAYSQ